jgi:shikimate kinase
MHLVLMGSKACGKSTIGKVVARLLNLPFEDVDSVLEAVHTERTGERKPFRKIYRERGETYFRELEEEALNRCLREGERVVALGGGAPARLGIDEVLRENFVVYLEASDDVLWERISRKGPPAYLNAENPREDFQKVLAGRKPIYERLADVCLNAEKNPQEIAAEIVSLWMAHTRNEDRAAIEGSE